MNQTIEYIKAFALFLAVAVVSGVIVMKVAMLSGGEIVPTPNIRGKEIIPALEAVNASGLNLKVVRMEFDPSIPKDRIISQEPKPATSLKRGRDVKVVISRGTKVALIPELVGSSILRAESVLQERDLKIIKKIFIHSAKPKNEILAQKPASYSDALRGDSMSLLISSGPAPKYVMAPNFIDQSISSVMESVKTMDIKIRRVAYDPTSEKDRGTVLRQEPGFGYRMEKGSYISLTVSEGITPEGDHPATYTFLYYTVPEGPSAVKVSITLENLDGEKEVYNRVHRPGDTVSLLVEIKGRTAAKIFLDNELGEVRRF